METNQMMQYVGLFVVVGGNLLIALVLLGGMLLGLISGKAPETSPKG